jgi:hypothetical protein
MLFRLRNQFEELYFSNRFKNDNYTKLLSIINFIEPLDNLFYDFSYSPSLQSSEYNYSKFWSNVYFTGISNEVDIIFVLNFINFMLSVIIWF